MRGKRHHQILIGDRIGLIPAYAGKTRAVAEYVHAAAAHPRVCGENAALDRSPKALQGSSPRMRGKPFFGDVYPGGVGLIPAYAGKTGPGL